MEGAGQGVQYSNKAMQGKETQGRGVEMLSFGMFPKTAACCPYGADHCQGFHWPLYQRLSHTAGSTTKNTLRLIGIKIRLFYPHLLFYCALALRSCKK